MTAYTTTPVPAADSHAERMAEIEVRSNAATPGPWEWDDRDELHGFGGRPLDNRIEWEDGHPGSKIIETDNGCYMPRDGDAEFIKHARSDIPWLLAELRAAQAEIGLLHTLYDSLRYDELTRELSRMRAVVDAARLVVAAEDDENAVADYIDELGEAVRAIDATEGKQP